MYHGYKEKRKMANYERDRRTKSRINKKTQRKRIFKIFGNIENQINGDKRKVKKEYLRRTRKLLQTKIVYSRHLHKGINTWCLFYFFCKILGTLLKLKEGRTSTNETGNMKNLDDAKSHTSPRWYWQTISKKKRSGSRENTTIEDSIDTSIKRLKDYKNLE